MVETTHCDSRTFRLFPRRETDDFVELLVGMVAIRPPSVASTHILFCNLQAQLFSEITVTVRKTFLPVCRPLFRKKMGAWGPKVDRRNYEQILSKKCVGCFINV